MAILLICYTFLFYGKNEKSHAYVKLEIFLAVINSFAHALYRKVFVSFHLLICKQTCKFTKIFWGSSETMQFCKLIFSLVCKMDMMMMPEEIQNIPTRHIVVAISAVIGHNSLFQVQDMKKSYCSLLKLLHCKKPFDHNYDFSA